MLDFWKGKKVLVTGGAGFIGSHVVEKLVYMNCEVTVADNLKRGNTDNLNLVMDKIEFLDIDLTKKENCELACYNKDIVLHLASDAYGISYGDKHHSEIIAHNLLLNTNVLQACKDADIKQVLVMSSSCVYPDDVDTPAKEENGFQMRPESAHQGYGWSKRVLELHARFLHDEYGMNIAIIRPTNVYGPRDPIEGKGSHVIPSLIKKVLFIEGDSVDVWGSGEQSRDFIYVEDMADAIILLAEKGANAEPINVGCGMMTSMKELISKIVEVTDSKKLITYDRTKPEGTKCKSVDISKAKQLSFESKVKLVDGLRKTVDYYKKIMS